MSQHLPDAPVSRAEFASLLSVVTHLETELEQMRWHRRQQVFASHTLGEACENIIVHYYLPFGIDRHVLHAESDRRPGRRSVFDTRNEMYLEEARLWLLCMLRQCTRLTFQQLKNNYPWITTRRFSEAGNTLTQTLAHPMSPHRDRWRSLLTDLRKEGERLGVNVDQVEEELRYA